MAPAHKVPHAAPASRKSKPRRTPGEGTTFESPKGSGRWVARLTINGKVTRRRATSQQAAEARLAELRELRRQRIDVHRGTQALGTWITTCHQEKVALIELKPRTVEFNLDLIERYIMPKLGALCLADIRPGHIQDALNTIYQDIRSTVNPQTNKPRYEGARTVRGVARILKEVLTLAHERRLIPDNPYSGIRLPKYRRKTITPLTDAQCHAFLMAAAGLLDKRKPYKTKDGKTKRPPKIDARLFPLWASYLFLGMRRGEGLGLRCEDIDLLDRYIHIGQQIQRVNGRELAISTPKTEDSDRFLPLPMRLQNMLDRVRQRLAAAHGALGVLWSGQGLMFVSGAGTALWPDNLETMFRRIREAAGLPETIKLHHLRHTLSTLLDECGASEALKAGILGHAKETETQKYTHARMEAMRVVLQRVEDRVWEGLDQGLILAIAV